MLVRTRKKPVEIVKRLATENDLRFEQTLGRVNQLLEQLMEDSRLLGERVDAITSSALDLVNRNSDSIDLIVTELKTGIFRLSPTHPTTASRSWHTECAAVGFGRRQSKSD